MKKPKIPIISIDDFIKNFSNVFSKPQFIHFESIIKGKLFSYCKSVLKCSNFSSKNQSSLNRFMNSKAIKNDKILDAHFDNIKANLSENSDSYLIIDDSIAHHKYAKKIDGVGKHHDHLEGGFSQGHSVVISGISNNNIFFPLQSEVYIKKSDIRNLSDFYSKVQIAEEMIDKTANKFKVRGVLIDSWYASKEILNRIQNNGLFFYTMLKSNRVVTINKRKKAVNEQFKYLFPRDFKVVKMKEKIYYCASRIAKIRGLGKIKIVFTQQFDKKKNKFSPPHYLTTNNVDLPEKQILEIYAKRWAIEVNNRDIKQNLGFENSIIRNLIGIKRHFLFVNIAQAILSIKRIKNKEKMTSGSIQKQTRKEVIENILEKNMFKVNGKDICAQKIASII